MPQLRWRRGARPQLRFGPRYSEEVVLRNGRRVRLRMVRPSDKQRLAEGMQLLSPAARLARFLTIKQRLSHAELSYLTEFDGVRHVAFGAVLLQEDGSEGQGIGVARMVGVTGERGVAEPAIVVLDAWQNLGLGRILLELLVAAALERGIHTFRAEFLPRNDGIHRLLMKVSPGMRVYRRGALLVAEMPLVGPPEIPGHAAPPSLAAILRLAARRLVRLRARG